MSFEDRTPVRSAQWSAQAEVTALIVTGMVIAVVGAVIAYAMWPGEGLASDGGLPEPTGAAPLALLGCLIALVGQTMALIGVVAAGVRIGTRP